jgi:hypothetical protein
MSTRQFFLPTLNRSDVLDNVVGSAAMNYRRTGTPGNYRYEYQDASGKRRTVPSQAAVAHTEGQRKQAEVKLKRGFQFRLPGTNMSISAQPDPERRDVGGYTHHRLHVVGPNQLRTGAQFTVVTRGGEMLPGTFRLDVRSKGKPVPAATHTLIEAEFTKQYAAIQEARRRDSRSTDSNLSGFGQRKESKP